MGPKKLTKSPFGVFMIKMKRLDTSLRNQPMDRVVTHCARIWEALDPNVRNRFERLSQFVRQKGLNEWEINKLVDEIDVKHSQTNDNNTTTNEEEMWDENTAGAAAPQGVETAFSFVKYSDQHSEDVDSDASDVMTAEERFDALKALVESTANLSKSPIVCISFNVLVHTFEDPFFFPNEIGLTKLSVEKGVSKECYWKTIECKVPDGYYCKAKEHSDLYHKLPVFTKDANELDSKIREVFDAIYEFMSASQLIDSETNRKLVFCKPIDRNGNEDRIQVIGCLKWFDKQMARIRKSTQTEATVAVRQLAKDFKVVDLSELLFLMTNRYCESVRPKLLCIDDLSSPKFDYYSDLSCEIHSPPENPYCALGVANRIAYLFLDSLLFISQLRGELDIKLKPEHKPKALEIDSIVSTVAFNTFSRPRHQFPYSDNQDIRGFEPHSGEGDSSGSVPSVRKPYVTGLGRGRLRDNLKTSNK